MLVIATTLGTLAGLFVLFGAISVLLERRWPAQPSAPIFSRARKTDWLYWPFSVLVTGNSTRLITMGLLGIAATVLGYRGSLHDLLPWLEGGAGYGLGRLPWGAQLAVALLVGDFVNYWNHRLRHTRYLWPFHAVHHAPKTLDWLASAWMHPVDDAVDNVGVGIAVLAMGAAPSVWLAMGPVLFFFNMWIHGNLRLRLGPLAYVIATPAFHRWHHAAEAAGPRGRNFAGIFPVYDLVFGTFALPPSSPASFGPGDEPVPPTLMRQLVFPFARLIRGLSR